MGEDNASELAKLVELSSGYDELYSKDFVAAFNTASQNFHQLYSEWKNLIFKQLDKQFGIDLGTLESLTIRETEESHRRLREVFTSRKIKAIPLVAQIAEYNALIAEIDYVSAPSEEGPRYDGSKRIQEQIRILMQTPYEIEFLKPYWKARRLLDKDRRKNRTEISKTFKEMEEVCDHFKQILKKQYGVDYDKISDNLLRSPKIFLLSAIKSNVDATLYFAQIFEFEALKAKRKRSIKKQKLYEERVMDLITLYYKTRTR